MILKVLIILSVLWFIRTSKIILFYIYLWQVKEYHIKRFLAHFKTSKGVSLILNGINIIKIFLFFNLILLFYLLPVVYLFETLKLILDFIKQRFKKPIITKKTFLLIFITFGLEVLFIAFLFFRIKTIFWFPVLFLIADLSTPLIVSLIIFVFKPVTFFWTSRIMKKAKKKRQGFKNLIVVGITGSYGKSSTKEFLATILSEKFRVLKTLKNINAEIGIAQTILKELNSSHQVFVAEIGAYERGKIKQVCKMLQPKIGILTGINEQHMATFGSLENTKRAKYELIEGLPRKGIAIIKDKLDLKAEDIKLEKEHLLFKVNNIDFKVNLLGRHNIDNILLAISCAQKLGMSLAQISETCVKIKPEHGGMTFLKKQSPVILDSSYSANPNGVIADLEYLKLYSGPEEVNRKVIVMPCLIELGRAGQEVHQRIGKKISEVCDLAIITTKDYFEEIKKQAPNSLFIENSKEIIEKIKGFDIILLEGRLPKQLCQLLSQFLYL